MIPMLAGFLEATAVLQVGVEEEVTLTQKRRIPSTRVTLDHHIVREVQEDGTPTEVPSKAMVMAEALKDRAGEEEAARIPTVATPTTHMKMQSLTSMPPTTERVFPGDLGIGAGRELEEAV